MHWIVYISDVAWMKWNWTHKRPTWLFSVLRQCCMTYPVSLNFSGAVVHERRSVKNLGVIIHSQQNYQPHIDLATQNCTGNLMAMSHAQHVMPHSTLKRAVQALVLSTVNFCASVYISCGVTSMQGMAYSVKFHLCKCPLRHEPVVWNLLLWCKFVRLERRRRQWKI